MWQPANNTWTRREVPVNVTHYEPPRRLMRQDNPQVIARSFACGSKQHLTPKGQPERESYVPYYNEPVRPFCPDCASAAETDSDPLPASRTYIINARDFHLPARWICSSGIPCVANWIAPPILPESNAYCAGSVPLLSIMSLNAAAASIHVIFSNHAT